MSELCMFYLYKDWCRQNVNEHCIMVVFTQISLVLRLYLNICGVLNINNFFITTTIFILYYYLFHMFKNARDQCINTLNAS